jgi:SSS family transporter
VQLEAFLETPRARAPMESRLDFRALGPLDILVVVLYLAGVLAAGAVFSRRQQTTGQYFLGGRRVPWWAVSASIVATETSTITFVSVPGILFARGGDFRFLQLVFGYLLGRIVISILLIPLYFRGELLTVYQVLQTRFGPSVRALAASLFVVMRTVADGVRLLLTALVLTAVTIAFVPTMEASTALIGAILLLGLVMIAFTLMGGMEAVIWIEVAQLGIYLFGAAAAAIVLADQIPGGISAAIELGREHGKLGFFSFALDPTRSYTFWGGVIGGCFLTMSTHGTDQYLVQRYLCTEGPSHARRALLTSGAVVLVQFAGFLFIGLLLFAFYRPFERGYGLTGDRILPDFLVHHLPTPIAGLVVAAILAAALSSSLNAIAATALSDLYRPAAGAGSDSRDLAVSRLFTLVAGVAQVAVAFAIRNEPRTALDTALSVASLLNGPVLGVFLIAAVSRRAGTLAALAGMAAGLAAVIFVWRRTSVWWPWYAAIGATTTLTVGLLVSRLSLRPELEAGTP